MAKYQYISASPVTEDEANLAIGILGVYYIAPTDKAVNNMGTIFILSLNAIIGCYIYIDAFIKTIPGRRKIEKP